MTKDNSSDMPFWEPLDDKPNDAPPWDQQEADDLIGMYVLIGITWLEADGQTFTKQSQYHGRIATADEMLGFEIECGGIRTGQIIKFPPDLKVFQVAARGEYKLRSTGEIVTDPDLLASWTIKEPVKS